MSDILSATYRRTLFKQTIQLLSVTSYAFLIASFIMICLLDQFFYHPVESVVRQFGQHLPKYVSMRDTGTIDLLGAVGESPQHLAMRAKQLEHCVSEIVRHD